MNQLKFEIAPFCFDQEFETGFPQSAGTPHHFFDPFGPSWGNSCLQWVKIEVGTSWNIPLKNIPDLKALRLIWRLEGDPICLSQKSRKINFAPFQIFPFFWLSSANFPPSSSSLQKLLSRDRFTRGCAWLLKLFPNTLNRFPTPFELLQNLLIHDSNIHGGKNPITLRLFSHNLIITWLKLL